ncbi:MAG: tail fiber domain-containing protein [Bdellovibrionaceae bacterium]|nr:tail fiber domain-containing protein [Pseudobdellovibrionaceae bacterium]
MGDLGNAIQKGYDTMQTVFNPVKQAQVIGDSLDITGAKSTQRAIDAQRDATTQANNTMRDIYNQQRADMEPWLQAGTSALSSLSNNDFMNNWQTDPGYQFRLDEGNKAINSAAAARGNAMGGATMKALTRYGSDYASNEYDKVYNRNNNRLSMLAGFGNNASNTNVNSAGNYGQTVASNYIGMGNANAAANIGQGNRMSQLLGQGLQAGAVAFSDIRLKKNISAVPKEELAEMKKHLRAIAFNYVDDKYGKGDWIGIIAQDLEKSKLGKTLVMENKKGEKILNLPKVLSLFLATMATEA